MQNEIETMLHEHENIICAILHIRFFFSLFLDKKKTNGICNASPYSWSGVHFGVSFNLSDKQSWVNENSKVMVHHIIKLNSQQKKTKFV